MMRWTILVALALAGCGDNPNGSGGNAGTGGAAGAGGTAGTGGTGPVDESTNCADAVALTSEINGLGGVFYSGAGVIGAAGDVDYFSVTAGTDSWLVIATTANPDGDPEKLDTRITLHTADGGDTLAGNDNNPNGGPDSELVHHVRAGGTLCIAVEDSGGLSAAGFDYGLTVLPLDFGLYDGFDLESEPNDDNNDADPLSLIVSPGLGASASAHGLFSLADADVFELAAPAGTLHGDVLFLPTVGPDGYGSTAGIVEIEVFNNGALPIARLSPLNGAAGISMPMSEGADYQIRVVGPASALGNNPFYVVAVSTAEFENQPELDDVANSTAAGAEIASPSPTVTGTSHFIAGTWKDTADWWSFQASAGQTVTVICSSRRSGSGVRDMTVGLYHDPNGAPLQAETETDLADLSWSTLPNASQPPVTVSTNLTHYLRIDATAQAADVTGNSYRCGIHVLP